MTSLCAANATAHASGPSGWLDAVALLLFFASPLLVPALLAGIVLWVWRLLQRKPAHGEKGAAGPERAAKAAEAQINPLQDGGSEGSAPGSDARAAAPAARWWADPAEFTPPATGSDAAAPEAAAEERRLGRPVPDPDFVDTLPVGPPAAVSPNHLAEPAWRRVLRRLRGTLGKSAACSAAAARAVGRAWGALGAAAAVWLKPGSRFWSSWLGWLTLAFGFMTYVVMPACFMAHEWHLLPRTTAGMKDSATVLWTMYVGVYLPFMAATTGLLLLMRSGRVWAMLLLCAIGAVWLFFNGLTPHLMANYAEVYAQYPQPPPWGYIKLMLRVRHQQSIWLSWAWLPLTMLAPGAYRSGFVKQAGATGART
jgi:hypothetical protein